MSVFIKSIPKKNRRILMVAYGHANVMSASMHRSMQIAKALKNAGYQVLCLWFSPWYSCMHSDALNDLRAHVRTIVCPAHPLFCDRVTSAVSRRLCSLGIRLVAKLWHPHCIQAEMDHVAALVATARTGVPMVCDFHGDIVAERRMQRSPNWMVHQSATDTRVAVNRADAVVCASTNLRDKVLRDVAGKSILSCVLPCSVDLPRFALCREQRMTVRKELELSDRTVICYSGGTAVWQCIPETIRLVSSLQAADPSVFFLLLTHGDLAAWQAELAHLERRDSLLVLSVPPRDVPRLLAAADIGCLLRTDDPVNRVASPTKCAEYLAAGVPILTTPYAGDAPRIIDVGRCGCILEGVHLNERDLGKAVRYINIVMSDRQSVSDRCVEAAMRYHNWDTATTGLQKLYERLVTMSPSEVDMHTLGNNTK